jgi:transcriptional regulator with XRE-family HTH domain
MSKRKRPADFELHRTYLREWRKSKDMTLDEVGKLMGMDKSSISKMERGLTPYNQIHLQQMRDIYNVEIPDLLYTDPKRPKAALLRTA